MLDALIEQLPGAELKENGVITVNGRPVSSLLVNGKDLASPPFARHGIESKLSCSLA